MSSETDKTNPKDLLGVLKVPLGLVPAAGKIYAAVAMADGAKKYGPYNWRDKKVKLSVYLDAMERHLIAYRDGEDCASDSKLPHLSHIIACGCILADAIEGGFLIDDRPTKGPAAATLDRFKKEDPRHSVPAKDPIANFEPPKSVSETDIPNGYRRLERGEIIQKDDFFWSNYFGEWSQTGSPDQHVGLGSTKYTYIRRV